MPISKAADENINLLSAEDQQDFVVIADHMNEPEISYDELLENLKLHDKL